MEIPIGQKVPCSPWIVLGLVLAPAMSAVWLTPWFVTQDGPAHLYNAEILRAALHRAEHSPYASAYVPRWSPVPNWGGHLLLMALLELVSPRVADRAMTSITLFAVPAAILWLRQQVHGPSGQQTAALAAALLGMSLPWLLGFGAFLLGLALGLVTLGFWWRWRDRLNVQRVAVLGALLVLGYLGHLVALGLTALGLVVLACLSGGDAQSWRHRAKATALALIPLGPLGLLYKATTAGSGEFAPVWEHLAPVADPRSWVRQLGWADPITLGRRASLPLAEHLGPSSAWLLVAPALWFGLGLILAARAAADRPRIQAGQDAPNRALSRAPWAWLGAVGLLGALLGPDSFGEDHGHYLPQRLALFGMAAAVVAVGGPGQTTPSRLAGLAWIVALFVQTLTVWDYARESSLRVGALMAASPAVGQNQRVGTLLIEPRGRFRANPLLHADCLLGLDPPNIIWNNYETRFYYFPVQVRPGLDAPPAAEFEEISLLERPEEKAARDQRWQALLRRHGQNLDRLVIWGPPDQLAEIDRSLPSPKLLYQSEAVRVFGRPAIARGLVDAGAPEP